MEAVLFFRLTYAFSIAYAALNVFRRACADTFLTASGRNSVQAAPVIPSILCASPGGLPSASAARTLPAVYLSSLPGKRL